MSKKQFNYEETKKDIKKAMSGLRIPVSMLDDAYQVGFVASLEGKNIRTELRAWNETEKAFRDNFLTGRDMGFALENPTNKDRLLAKANPKFVTVIEGDNIQVYEEI